MSGSEFEGRHSGRAVVPAVPRIVRATRYVTPFREGGSLPGLVEADDDGLYVVKFRGAAQGARALVAELLAGELGRAIGLPVPELVFVDIDPALASAEPDYWVSELLEKSPGTNVGLDFLPGSLTFSAAADVRPTPELAADVVWFDSLVTNADRSPRNPNMLAWHRRLYLIDHGAALFIHHSWQDPDAHARRPLSTIRDHVLLSRAGSIQAAHDRLAPLVTGFLVRELVSMIPDAWLEGATAIGDAAAQREAYVRYLATRLEAHGVLARQLDEARRAG